MQLMFFVGFFFGDNLVKILWLLLSSQNKIKVMDGKVLENSLGLNSKLDPIKDLVYFFIIIISLSDWIETSIKAAFNLMLEFVI